MLHFYKTCLNLFSISSLFSDGIFFFSKSLKFSSEKGLGFIILSATLFHTYSTVALAALWSTFLGEVFRASNPVVAMVSNNYFAYLLDRFLLNYKSNISFDVFSCSWFDIITLRCEARRACHFYLLISNFKLILLSIFSGLPF